MAAGGVGKLPPTLDDTEEQSSHHCCAGCSDVWRFGFEATPCNSCLSMIGSLAHLDPRLSASRLGQSHACFDLSDFLFVFKCRCGCANAGLPSLTLALGA